MPNERLSAKPALVKPEHTPEQLLDYNAQLSVYRYAINSDTQAILQVLFEQEATVRQEDDPVHISEVINEVLRFADTLGMEDCGVFLNRLLRITGRTYPRLSQSKALVYVLNRREQAAIEIAKVKYRFGMPIKDLPREQKVIDDALEFCVEKGLPETEVYVARFMRMVIDRSCEVQERFLAAYN